MRTYARIKQEDGTWKWATVETDASGDNTYVWLNTLVQCLKLVKGESPFYAQYGIGSIKAVQQSIFPDFDVNLTQQQFAQYFASLQITRVSGNPPTYNVVAIAPNGTKMTGIIEGQMA